MDFNKLSRNVEKIFDLLPGSWQQSAFSGKRCTAQFPIPQVKVPSHSSSLSQSPSWSPHLLCFVQQFQELPLLLQVSWPLQLVASSHATTKDKKVHTIDSNRKSSLNSHLNFVLNFLSIRSSFLWPEQLTHTKKEQFAKTSILYNDRNLQLHTNLVKLAKLVFANLPVSLVKDDLIENRGNLITKIGHKASQFSI